MEEKDMITFLEAAKKAALAAGEMIMKVYNSGNFDVETKGDNSPLTKADRAAHHIIMDALEGFDIPVLSEEGRDIPYEERKSWNALWVIDPLDGTKEFIKRNGEFTVNIALVESGEPILGVVYAPVPDKLFAAASGIGATLTINRETSSLKPIPEYDASQSGLRVVASRSHLNDDTKAFLNDLNSPEIVSMGSSLKFMMIAEGLADVYPRYAPTMEWDTAAAHAVLSELGGKIIDQDGNSLRYNKENLLNPYFRAS